MCAKCSDCVVTLIPASKNMNLRTLRNHSDKSKGSQQSSRGYSKSQLDRSIARLQEKDDVYYSVPVDSPRYFLIGRTQQPKWILKHWNSNSPIPYACADARLWKVILPDIASKIEGILNDEGIPEGVKEQIELGLGLKSLSYQSKDRQYEPYAPNEVLFKILSNNNPYELLNSPSVSGQFASILSDKRNLDILADIWDLPHASTLSNLADLWKTTHVTDQYKKYNVPSETLIHFMLQDDLDMFKRALDETGQEDDLFQHLQALSVLWEKREFTHALMEKDKEAQDYWYSEDILLLLLSDEYYDLDLVKYLVRGEEPRQIRSLGVLIASVEDTIPEEAFRFLFETYVEGTLGYLDDYLEQTRPNSRFKHIKSEIITSYLDRASGLIDAKRQTSAFLKYAGREDRLIKATLSKVFDAEWKR